MSDHPAKSPRASRPVLRTQPLTTSQSGTSVDRPATQQPLSEPSRSLSPTVSGGSAFQSSSFSAAAQTSLYKAPSSSSQYRIARPLRSDNGSSSGPQERSTLGTTAEESRHRSPSHAYPNHLHHNSEPSTIRETTEPAVVLSPEDEELDNKLRDKEAKMTWDDKYKIQDQAVRVREEVISTEKTYVDNLLLLQKAFITPLQQANLSEIGMTAEQRTALLSNLPQIVSLQKAFYDQLRSDGPNNIERTIQKYANFFRIYSTYATEYTKILETFNALSQNKKAQAFFTMVDKHLAPESNGSEQLTSYLIQPVQRIPRYELLLRELKRNTLPTANATVFDYINSTLYQIRQTAAHINETRKKVEHMSSIVQYQRSLRGDLQGLELLKPHRRLIAEATVYCTKPNQKRMFGTIKPTIRKLALFNDILLFANSDNVFKYTLNLPTLIIRAYDPDLPPPTNSNSKNLNMVLDQNQLEISNADYTFILSFPTNELCAEWRNMLEEHITIQQNARNAKRNITNRHSNQRTLTHRLIMGQFQTLSRNGALDAEQYNNGTAGGANQGHFTHGGADNQGGREDSINVSTFESTNGSTLNSSTTPTLEAATTPTTASSSGRIYQPRQVAPRTLSRAAAASISQQHDQ